MDIDYLAKQIALVVEECEATNDTGAAYDALLEYLRGELPGAWLGRELRLMAERDAALKAEDIAVSSCATAQAEVERLLALINTPRTDDFFEAVRIEAAHQVERWGAEHDAGKRAEDWIALFMYLLGKATKAHYDGDRAKLEHHVITAAAVALNWHRNLTGVSTAMRPGIGEDK